MNDRKPETSQPFDLEKLVNFIKVKSTFGAPPQQIVAEIENGLVAAIWALLSHLPPQARVQVATALCCKITSRVVALLEGGKT